MSRIVRKRTFKHVHPTKTQFRMRRLIWIFARRTRRIYVSDVLAYMYPINLSIRYFVCISDLMARAKWKGVLEHAQNARTHIYPAHAQSQLGICSLLERSIVPIDSFSSQWRPWSDCAYAQADRDLRCPHMPEDTFSHGAAHIHAAKIITSHTSI